MGSEEPVPCRWVRRGAFAVRRHCRCCHPSGGTRGEEPSPFAGTVAAITRPAAARAEDEDLGHAPLRTPVSVANGRLRGTMCGGAGESKDDGPGARSVLRTEARSQCPAEPADGRPGYAAAVDQ
jgi:hypothetical protein